MGFTSHVHRAERVTTSHLVHLLPLLFLVLWEVVIIEGHISSLTSYASNWHKPKERSKWSYGTRNFTVGMGIFFWLILWPRSHHFQTIRQEVHCSFWVVNLEASHESSWDVKSLCEAHTQMDWWVCLCFKFVKHLIQTILIIMQLWLDRRYHCNFFWLSSDKRIHWQDVEGVEHNQESVAFERASTVVMAWSYKTL